MDIISMIFNSRVLAENKLPELKDKYMRLKTDQERIIFTLNIMLEYKLIPSATGMPKDANKSEKLRKLGNEIFTKGCLTNIKCIDALKIYTKSVAFAPYPSEQLAFAYANRSAVLFELGLYSECIEDIDRAMTLNYPDNLKPKLYVRRAECSMILGSCSVEDNLKEAQDWLDKISLNESLIKKKLQSKLDTLCSKAVQTKSVENNSTPVEVKKLGNESPFPTIECPNEEAQCASDAIAIRYNTHYGRHIIATRDINPGEVIVVEKPYTLLLIPDNMQTHCSNCMKVCWANIPCNYCTYAMYCSEECKYAEWEKCHNIECAVFPVLIEHDCYNLDLFSLRLAVLAIKEAGSIKDLKTMLKKLEECDDPRTKGFSQDGKLHNNYISVYNFATNTEKRPFPDLLRRSMDACFILYFLATRTKMFGAKLPEHLSVLAKNDDVVFFGSLIFRYQQIVPINIHTFSEEKGIEFLIDGSECVKHCLAALPFSSLFNHSCDPNVFRVSRSNHSVMYAIRPIQKDEQLFGNYGLLYGAVLKETRQQKLFKQYFFICNCVPCQKNWPLSYVLPSFMTLVRKSEGKTKIKRALRKLNTYIHIAEEGNVQDKPYIIRDLLKMVQILYKYAPMPCREIIEVIETLKRVYALNGNRFEVPQIRTHWK